VNRSSHPFLASMFAARLADQILLFIVPLVVFQVTGSVQWSGVAFFVETLPRFMSFPICGILCDRISPVRLMHWSQLMRAGVCVLGMAGYAAWGGIAWLIAISALCGVLTTQGVMAREVMLPQVFRQHDFQKVLSFTQIADQLGMVLGPMLAAFLLKSWHWAAVVAACSVLFVLADLTFHWWHRLVRPVLADPEAPEGRWWTPLVSAAAHLRHRPGLIELVVLAAGVNLVVGVTLATSAAMFTGVLGASEIDYGWLQTAGAAATVAILFAIGHWTPPVRMLGPVAYAMMFAGGLLSAGGASIVLYAAGFVAVIGFDKMFNVYIRSLRQQIIPQRDLGKTTGLIVMLNNLTQPLAGLLVGAFSGVAGPRGVILALTLGMGVLGVAGALAWRHRSDKRI